MHGIWAVRRNEVPTKVWTTDFPGLRQYLLLPDICLPIFFSFNLNFPSEFPLPSHIFSFSCSSFHTPLPPLGKGGRECFSLRNILLTDFNKSQTHCHTDLKREVACLAPAWCPRPRPCPPCRPSPASSAPGSPAPGHSTSFFQHHRGSILPLTQQRPKKNLFPYLLHGTGIC
jgi:hypothetical protein